MPISPAETYDQRVESLGTECQRDQQLAQRFTWVRGVTFVATVTLFMAGATSPDARQLAIPLGACFLLVLVVAIVIQERVERRLTLGRRLLNLYRASAARCRRNWDEVPTPDVALHPHQEPLAFDLDLTGKGSLMHLVCRTHTTFGREALRDMLLDPVYAAEIQSRQSAVQELSPQHEWRTEFELLSMAIAFGQATPTALSEWADAPDAGEGNDAAAEAAFLAPLAWILPTVVWTSLLLAILFSGGIWLNLAMIAVIVSFGVALWYTGEAFQTLEHVTTSQGEVTQYEAMFHHATSLQPQSEWLAAAVSPLAAADGGPAAELSRLGRITRLSSLRRAGFLQAVLYMLAQLLFLADLHLLVALRRWRRRNHGRVAAWFALLGKVEAVSSLAGLAFDHPEWTMPEVTEDHDTIQGRAVGHPLLRDDVRVNNDVQVGPPGTLLLVTGSNMSGKSTLLRSIGLNALLAQAGGPACAEHWELPPVRLGTSVRVHDSLADGVSFFMAELKRLKQVVDMAREDGPRLLYLLDEILQGTNSAERQIAVSHVLKHLLDAGAIGGISTHDLELASLEDLSPHCRTVHFRETLGADGAANTMSFDYQLREGVATTTNALKLLELVGLESPSES